MQQKRWDPETGLEIPQAAAKRWDPETGLEIPAAGAQESAQRAGTKPIADAYKRFISNPLDRASEWIKNLPTSPVAGPISNEKVLTNLLTSPLQLVAHPKDNADVIGGIVGDVAATYASGGTSLPWTIARRAGMGALGQVIGGMVKRDGDTSNAPMDAVWGGAAPLAVGTAMGVGGWGAQKLGRGMARHALEPSEQELFQLWLAKYGTPNGFNVGKAEKLLMTDAFDRGKGAIGGQTYAAANQGRADASEIATQGIVSKTRREAIPPFQLGEGSDVGFLRSETAMPKPEFSINLEEATRGVETLRRQLAGRSGGMRTQAAGKEIDAAKASFLNRPADSRPFDLKPNQLLLEEGSLKVPLPEAVPDAPGVLNPARAAQETVPVDAKLLTTLGGAPVTAPQGVMMMPVAQARELRAKLLEAMADPTRQGEVATARELVESLNKVLPEAPGVPSHQVGFDTGLETRRALDKDLMADYQANAMAGGRRQDYVPSPTGETAMSIRGRLSDQLKQVAPMGELDGQSINLSDLMDRYSQDVVWNQLAQRATGAQGGTHLTAGANRTGTPYVRTIGNLSQFSGPLAKVFHTPGKFMSNNASNSMTLYRILQGLSRPKGEDEQ